MRERFVVNMGLLSVIIPTHLRAYELSFHIEGMEALSTCCPHAAGIPVRQ
jgi:hypothetical protein